MGKYRTCVKIKSGHRALLSATDGKEVSSSNSSVPHLRHHKNGNTCGKFEGNSQNLIPHHNNRGERAKAKRHIIVTIYARSLVVIYLVHITTTNAQPLGESRNKSIPSIISSTSFPLFGNDVKDVHLQPDQTSLVGPNCTLPSADDFPADLFTREAKRHGAIIFHFMVSIYLFYALLLVCEEYFVPAVESICRELGISSDVAGATFMAISTSAPELFTNVIGTFITKGDLGVGTIVGSAVFNILAVGACCGIGAGYSLQDRGASGDKVGVRLEWWPFTRDSIFYLASVGTLIIVLYNRKVYWTEALFMLFIYVLYVLALCYNTKLKNFAEEMLKRTHKFLSMQKHETSRRTGNVIGKFLNVNERTPLLLQATEKDDLILPPKDANGNKPIPKCEGYQIKSTCHLDLLMSKELDISAESLDQVLILNTITQSTSFSQQRDCSGWCKLPPESERNWNSMLKFIVSWPIRFLLWITVPNCQMYPFKKWYWVTLLMCVGWIGGLTYLISWMVTIIGDTFSIPDSVTGLTFLAAGTSIPEVISSLIVARQGLGSMAFSNTIGSNTFDVLVCLGLPWVIKSAMLSASDGLDYIEIHSGGLEYSAVILVSVLVFLYLCLALNGFILDRKLGLACVLMYFIFISLAIMLEMNVFFPVNLQPC